MGLRVVALTGLGGVRGLGAVLGREKEGSATETSSLSPMMDMMLVLAGN